MRKINLLFLLMLSLMGITQTWAQETYVEDFESVTLLDVDTYGRSQAMSNGWKVVGTAYISANSGSYQYSLTTDYRHGGNKAFGASYGSTNSFWLAITDKQFEGNVTFWYCRTRSSGTAKVTFWEIEQDGDSWKQIKEIKTVSKSTNQYEWSQETVDLGSAKYVGIQLQNAGVDDMTFTLPVLSVEGSSFKVAGYKDGDSFGFGLVNPNTKNTFTIKNNGSVDLTVNIATTGNFTAPASVSVAAGEEESIEVTVPETFGDATGTVKFSADECEDVTVNLTATILDPSKMFETFAGGTPEYEWETTSSSSWYSWSYGDGYAGFSGSGSSYAGTLTSPALTFTENETLIFKTAKYQNSTYSNPSVSVQWSATGADDWTTIATYTDDIYGTWTERSVNVPATAKYIRFSGWYFYITNIYGGTPSQAPKMVVTAADHGFGMIAEETTTTFNIKNTGKSELTGIQVTSDNAAFTVSGVPTSLAAGEAADVTVTMGVDNKGAQTGVITVEAPEQTTATFNVSGYVMDNTLFTETFDNDPTARNWEKTGNWSFTAGKAVQPYGSNNYLTTPAITIAEGDVMAIEATGRYSSSTLSVEGSKDDGEWTTLKTFTTTDMGYNEDGENMQVVYLTDVPAGNYKLRFGGYYAVIGTVNGYHLNDNAPSMSVTPDEDATFGKVAAAVTKTYTVENVGTGELTVNIASDNDKFEVSPAQLVITDEAKTFTVTFTPEEGVYGSYEANITVTPTYNEELAKTIKATAKTVDPNVWSEDFEDGATKASLEADGWEISDGWAFGVVARDADNTTNQIYVADDYGSTYRSFVTPRLEAAEGEEMSFRSYYRWGDEKIKVSYSTDKSTWTEIESVSIDFGGTDNNYKSREMTFAAPMAGKFYLKFEGRYGAGFDDFLGFKLATAAEHEFQFSNTDIPTTGTQFVEYTAKVTVKNSGLSEDAATVKAYIGEEVVYTETKTIAAGEEEEFVFTFEPAQAYTDALIHFEVENENIETLVGEAVTVNIAAAVALDEDNMLEEMPTGKQTSVLLKYTAKAGWNTICVPFQLTDDILTQIFGENYKVYELKGYTDGQLKFNVATTRYERCPYIVYAEAPAANEDGFKLFNVSFSAMNTPNADQYGDATFQGTYAPIAAPDMQGKYGVVPSTGHIKKGGASASLKGYRAYFELPADADASGISLDFGDGTVITGIEAVELLNGAADVYDLNGRKMDNSNLQRGVYVINGKKVVVK